MLSLSLSLFGRRALALGLAAIAASAPLPALALGEDIQCVPYARQLTSIQIYGDAHTWWGQADGRYQRGRQPQVGSVLAFRPHGNMRLGHVAAVSRIVDSRTLLVSHSNWSTINGTRGHVENNVKVVDVSPRNDWSEVRVWYTPNNALGTTHWPTYGFIYSGDAPTGQPIMVAEADTKKTKKDKGKKQKADKKAKQPGNLLAQVGGDWIRQEAAREQQPTMAPAPTPRSAAPPVAAASRQAGLPAGYTPSVYAPGSTSGPGNLGELLARY